MKEEAFDPLTYPFPARVTREQDYGEAKRQAEAVFFRQKSFPVTAVRFPIVLGEDDYTERLKFHWQLVSHELPFCLPNLDAKISFLHAQDAAAFLHFLVDHEIPGPINCCSPTPISLRELVRQIELVAGKEAKVTAREDQGESSPFGIVSDWYMDAGKAQRAGFSASPILEWLPGLIRTYAQS
jgi:nucleoside-diphosphate-sugar epimerase